MNDGSLFGCFFNKASILSDSMEEVDMLERLRIFTLFQLTELITSDGLDKPGRLFCVTDKTLISSLSSKSLQKRQLGIPPILKIRSALISDGCKDEIFSLNPDTDSA